MTSGKGGPKNLIQAVQLVFEALEPFDEDARQRILSSAASLLGSVLPISGGAAALQNRASAIQFSPAATERPLSPIELIQEKKPATNAQRLAVFAYYRERVEGISRFAKEDLRPYFAKAKQPAPQNFDRDYQNAVKLGWIYDDGNDSYLTSKGLESVEAGFGGKGLPRGRSVSKAPRKKGQPQKRRSSPR